MSKLTEEKESVYVCEKCEYRQLYTSRKPFIEIFCLGCKSYRLFNLPNSLPPERDTETKDKLTEEGLTVLAHTITKLSEMYNTDEGSVINIFEDVLEKSVQPLENDTEEGEA